MEGGEGWLRLALEDGVHFGEICELMYEFRDDETG